MLKTVFYQMYYVMLSLFIIINFHAVPAESYAQNTMESQIEKALNLLPMQKGQVDYSIPAASDIPQCTAESIKNDTQNGMRILDPNGLILREFIITDGAKSINQWRYFRDGLEVYRDIDSNDNKKADNYRWFNTAGTRWGVDENEDGIIDYWKVISAEEVSAELVAAVATGDRERFLRLLPTADELKKLGVGEEKLSLIIEKVRRSPKDFDTAVSGKILPEGSRWAQFSGTAPSTFPSGTNGSTKDVDYYENAMCSVNVNGNDVQVSVGTLIRVGQTWRALDCPKLISAENVDELAAQSIFGPKIASVSSEPGINNEAYDTLREKAHNARTQQEASTLYAQMADLAEENANSAASSEYREYWIRTFVNDITAAVQQGMYPGGLERMENLLENLTKKTEDHTFAALTKLRLANLEYDSDMASGEPWLQARNKLYSSLEWIVENYPTAPDTSEAILQLIIEDENVGEDEKALQRCNDLLAKFPNSPSAVKATGAKIRLQSTGKPLPLSGKIFGKNQNVTLAKLKNRVTVVYFWTTWISDPVKEADRLKELQAKYKDLLIIGVNLDNDTAAFQKFITENRIPWTQIHEEGGMDSSPANQLGIFSVPTFIVIGKDGNVFDRNAQIGNMEEILINAGVNK
ncbi:MAG: TlpA disulfide reductase family protein [Planctomycetia bacterium]|nr:TlpA disulfide reductase family protein [Planctomycetia bacterium]